MIFNQSWKYKGIILLPILILFFSVTFSFAQSNLSIGVAPTFKTIELKPGEVYTGELVFWNQSSTNETYKVFVSGFEQIENQPGTAVILTPEDDALSPYSASKWVTVEKQSLTLESNKNIKLQYTIKVPQDITDGSYNVEIFLISESQFKQAGTAAFASLASGTPILIRIGDEFVENAELLKFVSDKKIYEKIRVILTSRIKNLGDTHIQPTGEIIIENIFRQQVARIPYNRNKQTLLRDTSGDFQDYWDQSGYLTPNKTIALGPMKAKLVSTYRTIQPGFSVLSAETTFWIIPWKLLIAILVVIILAIILSSNKKKARKKNETH